MSAIAGVILFGDDRVQPGLIEKLTAAMASRGPDGRSHWSSDRVALGHCMLRATPEAARERQPLTSSDGDFALVWDGRLDNREDLRRALHSDHEASDAELVLRSYDSWGQNCTAQLLGDFAFVIWDARHQHLFCVTDHMGSRPFYYCQTNSFLAFASEDEALTTLPGVSKKPNTHLIASYLMPAYRGVNRSRSFLEDISVLRPASILLAGADGKCRTYSHWRFEPGEESKFSCREECREAFLDVFRESVRSRLRASGSVAAMVSGGLDSASILAMSRRLAPDMPVKGLHTYSAVADDPEICIESQCIYNLIEDSRDRAHLMHVPSFTGIVNVQDLLDIGRSGAHPVDNSILLPAMMCLGASRDGHRVLLHGCSGDLTMHAPDRYIAHLLRQGHWMRGWRECRDASTNHTYLRRQSAWRLLGSGVWAAWVPGPLKTMLRPLTRGNGSPPAIKAIINADFARELGMAERLRSANEEAAVFDPDIQGEHLELLVSRYGIANGLRGYERVAGRFGVELRDPWADRRVVEFFLRLPLGFKVREGWTKYLTRNAFGQALSRRIRERTGREHLGWHFPNRLLQELKEHLREVIYQAPQISNYVDMNVADRNLSVYLSCSSNGGNVYPGSDTIKNELYATLTLSLWLTRINQL